MRDFSWRSEDFNPTRAAERFSAGLLSSVSPKASKLPIGFDGSSSEEIGESLEVRREQCLVNLDRGSTPA